MTVSRPKSATECPFFERRDLFSGNLCKYWKPAGQDHRGDPYPAHCSHREVIRCETQGFKVLPREDSDSDGEL